MTNLMALSYWRITPSKSNAARSGSIWFCFQNGIKPAAGLVKQAQTAGKSAVKVSKTERSIKEELTGVANHAGGRDCTVRTVGGDWSLDLQYRIKHHSVTEDRRCVRIEQRQVERALSLWYFKSIFISLSTVLYQCALWY